MTTDTDGATVISEGRAVLGVELGSTRIKAVLVDPAGRVLATGGHGWENRYVDRTWTYTEDDVWSGLAAAHRAMADDAHARHGVRPTALGGLGISAMMHGYLAADADGDLLVPFRTWRNTSTGQAATELTELLGVNIPLRWSVAHLYQAVLDDEPHLARVARLTTLAGLVHHRLSGRHVLGVGDASGMFPIDPATRDYDAERLHRVDRLLADRHPGLHLADLLPRVLAAGEDAGHLTAEGAALLDPSGTLQPGAPMCPPEGDAGTGMVATNAVAPRRGTVSVGTSIFAMAVLEEPLQRVHEEIDLVTTPAGDPVAMVHCNNGASELDAWAGVFAELAAAVGSDAGRDEVFGSMLTAALAADPDGGGLLAYNYLSGEPVTGLAEGRPLYLRTPDSRLTLGSFVRAQVHGAFATLALGLRVLADEGVALDVLVAHGGLFRTEGVAQAHARCRPRHPRRRRPGRRRGWGVGHRRPRLLPRPPGHRAHDLARRRGVRRRHDDRRGTRPASSRGLPGLPRAVRGGARRGARRRRAHLTPRSRRAGGRPWWPSAARSGTPSAGHGKGPPTVTAQHRDPDRAGLPVPHRLGEGQAAHGGSSVDGDDQVTDREAGPTRRRPGLDRVDQQPRGVAQPDRATRHPGTVRGEDDHPERARVLLVLEPDEEHPQQVRELLLLLRREGGQDQVLVVEVEGRDTVEHLQTAREQRDPARPPARRRPATPDQPLVDEPGEPDADRAARQPQLLRQDDGRELERLPRSAKGGEHGEVRGGEVELAEDASELLVEPLTDPLEARDDGDRADSQVGTFTAPARQDPVDTIGHEWDPPRPRHRESLAMGPSCRVADVVRGRARSG